MFDPPNVKMKKALVPKAAAAAEAVMEIARESAYSLSFLKREEVAWAVFATWLDLQESRHGLETIAPKASPLVWAAFRDQANGVMRKFTWEQAEAADFTVRALKDRPRLMDLDL